MEFKPAPAVALETENAQIAESATPDQFAESATPDQFAESETPEKVRIYSNYHTNIYNEINNLPLEIKELYIDNFKLDGYYFNNLPYGLEYIYIYNEFYAHEVRHEDNITKFKLPFNCKVIYLTQKEYNLALYNEKYIYYGKEYQPTKSETPDAIAESEIPEELIEPEKTNNIIIIENETPDKEIILNYFESMEANKKTLARLKRIKFKFQKFLKYIDYVAKKFEYKLSESTNKKKLKPLINYILKQDNGELKDLFIKDIDYLINNSFINRIPFNYAMFSWYNLKVILTECFTISQNRQMEQFIESMEYDIIYHFKIYNELTEEDDE